MQKNHEISPAADPEVKVAKIGQTPRARPNNSEIKPGPTRKARQNIYPILAPRLRPISPPFSTFVLKLNPAFTSSIKCLK